MIQAKTVLEAWDKTFETMDFSHLAQYLSDDFQVEYTTGEVDNLENTKSWCVSSGLVPAQITFAPCSPASFSKDLAISVQTLKPFEILTVTNILGILYPFLNLTLIFWSK